MFSVDGRFGHSAKNTDGALEKLLMVIPSGDCCRTGLIHAGVIQKSDSSWLYLFFLSRRPRYGFAHRIIFASERISSGSGFNASGSEKRTVAGDG